MEQDAERKGEEPTRKDEPVLEECPSCGETRRPHYMYECIRRMERLTRPIRSIW